WGAGNAALHADAALDHGAGGAAAAIAEAVAEQHFAVHRLGLVALPGAHHLGDREVGIVGGEDAIAVELLGGDQLRVGVGAVDALPPERVVGVPVGVVPAEFRGNEILEAGLGQDLRHVGGIAERVGQPHGGGVDAKVLDVEAAAAHDLADHALARDD